MSTNLGVVVLAAVLAGAAAETRREEAAEGAIGPSDTVVYVGTYTETKGNGIYAFRLQPQGTEVFQNVTLVPLVSAERHGIPRTTRQGASRVTAGDTDRALATLIPHTTSPRQSRFESGSIRADSGRVASDGVEPESIGRTAGGLRDPRSVAVGSGPRMN